MAIALQHKVEAGLVHLQFIDAAMGNTMSYTKELAAAGAVGGVDASPIGSFHVERKLSRPSSEMLPRHLNFNLYLQRQVAAADIFQAALRHSPECETRDDLMGANGLKPLTLLPIVLYAS